MKRCSVLLAAILLSCVFVSGYAQTDKSPTIIDGRYKALIAELRCLVCQNQSLADSNADLAVDMRREVRKLMDQGSTDAEIVAFLVARYGDFVRYRPPVKSTTLLLWFGPLLLLLIGVIIVVLSVRRHKTTPGGSLSDAEHRQARSLLKSTNGAKDQ